MLGSLPIILFNGVAYGILLFLMAGGLSITLGLMGFANLAHGAFGMLGGYLLVTFMAQLDWPFPLAVCAATVLTGIVGVITEQAVFKRYYRASELDQVLMTIAVIFMAIAGATYVWGQGQMPVRVPPYLSGTVSLAGYDVTRYRLFLLVVGGLLTAGLILAIEYTSFGAKVRAAVDNRRMTMSCGINVDRLFLMAFGLGTGLAGTRRGTQHQPRRAQPAVPPHLPDLPHAGGRGRRAGIHRRHADRGARRRHRRRRQQVLFPRSGQLRDLRADSRLPGLEAARPVRPRLRLIARSLRP